MNRFDGVFPVVIVQCWPGMIATFDDSVHVVFVMSFNQSWMNFSEVYLFFKDVNKIVVKLEKDNYKRTYKAEITMNGWGLLIQLVVYAILEKNATHII